MAASEISVKSAISYGWETVKKDLWYWVGIALVVLVLQGVGSDYDRERQNTTRSLLGILFTAWLTPGYIKLGLSYFEGNKLGFEELFKQFRYFWRTLGAMFLGMLIVLGGLILLIIPGFIFAARLAFVVNLIVDRDLGVFEAIKASWKLTEKSVGLLLFFMLASIGVIILGALALGVGVLVATPVIWLGHIYLYKKISAAKQS